MIVPALAIITAVTVHAGSHQSSPVSTPNFAPITAHLPPGDDLNLGPAYCPQTPRPTTPVAPASASCSGHMNFAGRTTPSLNLELTPTKKKQMKVCAALVFAANKP